MKFSISFLLGLTLLTSIGIQIWQNVKIDRANRLEIATLRGSVGQKERQLKLHNPDIARLIKQFPQQVEHFDSLRKTAQANQIQLRETFGKLKKPKGEKVVAVLKLEGLNFGPRKSFDSFKVWVPESRPVWLLYGVHSSRESKDGQDLLAKSPWSKTDPMQIRLSPGEHLIESRIYKPNVNLPTEGTLILDGKTLLTIDISDPDYDKVNVRTRRASWRSSDTESPSENQRNYATPKQTLPSLYRYCIQKREDSKEYDLRYWLSDKPMKDTSGFPMR